MVLAVINPVLRLFNEAVAYLQNNLWHIILLLGAGWFLKTQFIDPSISRASAHRLSKGSSSWGISTNRTNHQEEMRRVRLQQQQALDRLAQQAAARKKEEPPEPVPKPKKKKTTVRPLSSSSSSSGGYNPMQPWTSSAGGGYKAQRRTVRRG